MGRADNPGRPRATLQPTVLHLQIKLEPSFRTLICGTSVGDRVLDGVKKVACDNKLGSEIGISL